MGWKLVVFSTYKSRTMFASIWCLIPSLFPVVVLRSSASTCLTCSCETDIKYLNVSCAPTPMATSQNVWQNCLYLRHKIYLTSLYKCYYPSLGEMLVWTIASGSRISNICNNRLQDFCNPELPRFKRVGERNHFLLPLTGFWEFHSDLLEPSLVSNEAFPSIH